MAKKNGKKPRVVVTDAHGHEVRTITLRLTPQEWSQVDDSWIGRNGIESMLQELIRVALQSLNSAQALLNSPQPGADALKLIGASLVKTVSERVTLNVPPKVQKGIEIVQDVLSIFAKRE